MRLIDAEKLMDSLRGNVLIDVTSWLEEAIDEQPTVYDIDRVVEQLGEYCSHIIGSTYMIQHDIAEKIVKGGGVDENN